ncbi:phosphopyruvate hydratase [Singulisphaera sp. Ch08]|uniref:Enolase n=1 Tax=Singulisphaera sp. Ch08 TaxID=3120278 RepID=A0AAU7CL67_9BACT
MLTVMKLKGREVLDSRGRPTVEVEVAGSNGEVGRAIVPSGASTGRHEAIELRDPENRRHGGMGVLRAVGHVNGEIAAAIQGMDLEDQAGIDAALVALDGTANKGRLGANAILGVSLAVAHAAASGRGVPLYVHLNRLWRSRLEPGEFAEPVLPMPMVNLISGGLHAGANLDFQDFLMIPGGAPSYSEALEMTAAIYRAVGAVLREKDMEGALVGDEGGYGPKLSTNAQAVDLILEAVLACGLEPGRDVAIALDVAASHFYDPETATYHLTAAGDDVLDSAGMTAMLAHWAKLYPIVSIEDGLAEDDWNGWSSLTGILGDSVQLIGDDLFATQTGRLRQGIERHAGNAILIKVNQVGTLSETFDAILLARRHGYRTIVSARSGETEDTTIADLAVATAAGQIKIGSVARSERLAKYNRLLRIEDELGPTAKFAGATPLRFASARPAGLKPIAK